MQENKNKSYKQNFILEYEVWFLLRAYPVLTEYYKKLCNKWYFLQSDSLLETKQIYGYRELWKGFFKVFSL